MLPPPPNATVPSGQVAFLTWDPQPAMWLRTRVDAVVVPDRAAASTQWARTSMEYPPRPWAEAKAPVPAVVTLPERSIPAGSPLTEPEAIASLPGGQST